MKILIKNAVKRKKGYIYYIDQNGNLCEEKYTKVVFGDNPSKNRKMARKELSRIAPQMLGGIKSGETRRAKRALREFLNGIETT